MRSYIYLLFIIHLMAVFLYAADSKGKDDKTSGKSNNSKVFKKSKNSKVSKKSKNLSEIDMLSIMELKKLRANLALKEKNISIQEKKLKAKERALNEQINALKDLKKEISSLLTSANEAQEEKITKLVETLSKMSPKSSAAMLNDMSEKVSVETMSRIATEQLAKIMAE